ncbi:tetratricopeptide repeat protein 38-like [Ptychodera flava]|uniref:tetratricopeptide repeat protein 38-like n=1 Tax=Ptychodera flava TaxID=63121 RepID=UPI003969CA77
MYNQWRDCQEWQKQGLPLSTTNNETAKLYDAVLCQYVGWYDEDAVGGIEASAKKLVESDPNFVLGHVLVNGLDVMGTGRSIYLDAEFKTDIDNIVKLAENSNVSSREKLHAEAIKLWAYGDITKAQDKWEEVLVQYPTDMLALKFAHDSYFYMGYSAQIRDSIARVMPHWKKDTPLYGYLMGMHAFGLVETNLYDQAEKEARLGLDLNKNDAWSTHSLAHVFEMMGRQDEGTSFMSSTKDNWTKCGMLACHNYWHWALYLLEKGEQSAALEIFDSEVGQRVKSGALLDIVDSCSLLYRMEMEGVNVGERWKDVYEICKPHIGEHILCFNDIHLLMSTLGSKQKEEANRMMESIHTFINEKTGTQRQLAQEVGAVICNAFQAYDSGNFAEAVELFLPIRYQVWKIGGSNAQRDLFNLFLINAALKSPEKKHHQLARSLLIERKALKECAPMTDRLIGRAMALHVD